MLPPPPSPTLFPYTTLFRSADLVARLTRTRPQLDERAFPAASHGRPRRHHAVQDEHAHLGAGVSRGARLAMRPDPEHRVSRSEEHTSELQSHVNLVCRLLLE